MQRLGSLDRVRVITAAAAGGAMATIVGALYVADSVLVLGYLPGTAPLLILASAAVAAWRAEEAVATRSVLRWAWGSAWRTLVLSWLGQGLIMGVILGRAALDMPGGTGSTEAADVGFQVAFYVALFYAPVTLGLGLAVHVVAALAIRHAVRRWWAWFGAMR